MPFITNTISNPCATSLIRHSALFHSLLASPVSTPAVTLPISISVGVSASPSDNTELSSSSESSSTSSSFSIPDTSSASSSSSDSSSSSSSSSESPSTTSSESSPSTFAPPSTITQPPDNSPDERSQPPMSSETPSSSSPIVTDTPPPPSSSSSSSTSTMSSSVTPPPSSLSSSGVREGTDTTTSPSSTSNTLPSTSNSISSFSRTRINPISTTPTTTPTPPSTSDSSISTLPGGGGGGSSTGPSSQNRPGGTGSTTGLPNLPITTNGSANPVGSVPMQSNGSPILTPMTTLTEAVTFMTTDASGSTTMTVPPQFTTVIVTTLPGGTFTTVTEVFANPPAVLNPGDVNRDSVAAFFQNKGAVAGVFLAASLAIFAIALFVIFALRRRRYRVRTERDVETARLAANQRFAEDEDSPVLIPSVPPIMRGRGSLLDDFTGSRVGPPTRTMPVIAEVAYPLTAAPYIPARSNSSSPSPNRGSAGLPITYFEPASPTWNSGWSSHGGAAYLGLESVSPTTSAPASVNHGTVARAPSAPRTQSSHGGHRPPASAGQGGSGNGTGSGSGGTSQPSLMTATPAQRGASSSKLEDMYPPEDEQDSRPDSSDAVTGLAYEPAPVPHEHQIDPDSRAARVLRERMRSPLSADTTASAGSRLMYSHEVEDSREWDEEDDVLSHEDSRLDPVMRIPSVGPSDAKDYTRKVGAQPPTSPSTGSNSHSKGHSHSNH